MATVLNILCAGAVQGVVKALQGAFAKDMGIELKGQFGAVGAMKEALQAGTPCDVMIVTDSMISDLQGSGELSSAPRTPLGRVRTGVAVRNGDPAIDVATPDGLKASLLASAGVYFPDAVRSTAGIHFMKVLKQLGIDEQLASRCHTYPNGATAMRAMGDEGKPGSIGCTQITEIKYTEGIRLIGPLPDAFELATVYTAAVGARAADPQLAQRFIDALGGPASRSLREQGGFEF
jgi:molybdate transport system substrate-binding protein